VNLSDVPLSDLKEGVLVYPYFCELWLGDWYKREVVEWLTIGFASTAVANPVSSCRDCSFIFFVLPFRIVAPDALFT
jgi:hypothetical protein